MRKLVKLSEVPVGGTCYAVLSKMPYRRLESECARQGALPVLRDDTHVIRYWAEDTHVHVDDDGWRAPKDLEPGHLVEDMHGVRFVTLNPEAWVLVSESGEGDTRTVPAMQLRDRSLVCLDGYRELRDLGLWQEDDDA